MTSEEKRAYVKDLDANYQYWPPFVSEFTAFLVRDIDSAFCAGANLTVILAAHAAIDSHLRFQYGSTQAERLTFHDLIERSPIASGLKARLHELRVFRNQWVHVENPSEDQHLRDEPELHEAEIESLARSTMSVLREILYIGYSDDCERTT